MPIHALLGHLAIITAPLAALVALVYAWRPRARRGMRVPLVVFSVLNTALAIWAGSAGSTLLRALRAAGESAGRDLPATALAHAHEGDYLSAASFALMVAVLVLVWWILAPDRARGGGTLVAACVVTACAVAVAWFSVTTLVEGLQAVWAQHDLWPG